MKKYSRFINLYDMSKTLRFALIPIGKTEENFNNAHILEEDERRSENSTKVKKFMDRYHKEFIETVLKEVKLEKLAEYADLYYKNNRTEKEKQALEKIEIDLRKQIAKSFKSDDRFSKLFKADMIKELLPTILDDEEKRTVEEFARFTSYFTGFFENRKNMYSENAEATSIANRCINENLPKHLDNVKSFEKIKNILTDIVDMLNESMECNLPYGVDTFFCVDYYTMLLSQSSIDFYNRIIGGYTNAEGEKIKGINEYVNLYNQQHSKNEKLPYLKVLYKQILSDRTKMSFLPEKFESDGEVLKSLEEFYIGENGIQSLLQKIRDIFSGFEEYDLAGIYYRRENITALSQELTGNWGSIKNAWEYEYTLANPIKKMSEEKYEQKMKSVYERIEAFSLAEIDGLVRKEHGDNISVARTLKDKVFDACEKVEEEYSKLKEVLNTNFEKKRLSKTLDAVEKIKNFLDGAKELEKILKPLYISGKEKVTCDVFYGQFEELYTKLTDIDKLYDKTRNYITKKPYSTDKIKLNFNHYQLMAGWDRNKENECLSVILRKDGDYYLAVMNKEYNKVFADFECAKNEEFYEKMNYKLLPGPNKMLPKVVFASANKEIFKPSKEIEAIRKNETFKKGEKFNIDDCHKMIDFYKESIKKYEGWQSFGFKFKETNDYNDIGEFYNEVKEQGYSVSFEKISANYVESLINEGKIYLFKLYNKDFSKASKGTPNLHTVYFRQLFEKSNLDNPVYKLNGQAEMFYRKSSIKETEMTVHYANMPIDNKNPNNQNKTSTYKYDIVKDRRFTKRQFLLHVPITINFKSLGENVVNDQVKRAIKDCDENYVIGIDRGERNLIYICVINSKGEITEQYSLNDIVDERKGLVTNYRELLDKREKERAEERQSWQSIGNIKNLKEGYISQVVHKICELAVKYDAVIAMEDLNHGFKNSRIKVEKQVYQKFEKMLVDKLSLLVDKKADVQCDGGARRAYQLVNKPGSKSGAKQNGFIIYVNPWLTSKIDPVTGFVDLIRPKYTGVKDAKNFIDKIDEIRFNGEENMLEFDFTMSKFPKGGSMFVDKWTLYTNKDRIKTFKNKMGKWDNLTVNLTEEFVKLLTENEIDVHSSELKKEILNQNGTNFFEKFMELIGLMFQMRNSVANTDIDYMISPVKDKNGEFFDSRNKNENLPMDADANGAYNIAKKALYLIGKIKASEYNDLKNADMFVENAKWLEFVQKDYE